MNQKGSIQYGYIFLARNCEFNLKNFTTQERIFEKMLNRKKFYYVDIRISFS